MSLLTDFKPALLFLARFLAVYVVGNVLYGIYIESFHHYPDTVTRMVTEQTSALINLMGEETTTADNGIRPTVLIRDSGGTVLSVYEGCNGLNVMVVFVAFLAAFGGPLKKLLWFVPAGLLIIHVFNLLRVGLLYYVATHFERYFYFFHKYLFTGMLYAVVFVMWAWWVRLSKNVTPAMRTESQDA